MIISTLFDAARGQFDAHRHIARYTLPIWLYVAITGVVVFFLAGVFVVKAAMHVIGPLHFLDRSKPMH